MKYQVIKNKPKEIVRISTSKMQILKQKPIWHWNSHQKVNSKQEYIKHDEEML